MANSMCTFDTRAFGQFMTTGAQKQIRFATATALTKTAKNAVPAIQTTMHAVFNQPTNYTLNSVYVKPATKDDLNAEVRLKNLAGGGQTPASVYLAPEVFGGARQAKRSEMLMRQAGILPGGMFVMPGAGARMDRYGNMSRGQLIQILSATKSFKAAGFSANRTSNSFDRSKSKLELFVGKPAGGRDPLGIYARRYQGRGQPEKLIPLLLFISQPYYKPRLDLTGVVATVYSDSFQNEFNAALEQALATAR